MAAGRYRRSVPSDGTPPTDALAPGTTRPGYLAATVGEAAARFGDRPAFVDPDGTVVTYEGLHRVSDEVAAGLQRRGSGPGSVVALTLPSTSTWVVAYVAAAKAGATAAGVNPRLTEPERQACLDRVEPDVVLADDDAVASLAVRGGRPAPVANDPDRPAALVFTSGTTGAPKAAWFTDRQLTAVTTIDVGAAWGRDPLPQVGSTQFAHVGFTTKLPWYLRLGTTTHLLERWRASAVLDVVERERISTIGGVAPQVALLLRDPDLDRRDLSCVRLLVMGGAPSPPAMVGEARRRFDAAYSIRWSSTESGGVATGTSADDPDELALHTVGRPRPGIEVEARGVDGSRLPAGEVGELWISSPTTMAGYWADHEASAHALADGWLRTGDLGSVDHDGYVRLQGRIGEMYIRGGYNVHPAEVAAGLADHPAVAEVAVVPRPDPVLGEIGVAVVVPVDRTAPPDLTGLRHHASATLAHHKLPEDLVVVDELPLTAMQKLDRRALRRLATVAQPDAADGHGPGGPPAP
jgi:acyl-CoA synthetase (AMP-forming)/AMP-acid ligase II